MYRVYLNPLWFLIHGRGSYQSVGWFDDGRPPCTVSGRLSGKKSAVARLAPSSMRKTNEAARNQSLSVIRIAGVARNQSSKPVTNSESSLESTESRQRRECP